MTAARKRGGEGRGRAGVDRCVWRGEEGEGEGRGGGRAGGEGDETKHLLACLCSYCHSAACDSLVLS